ncbi:zinc metalloproteinase nas-13-like [Actinia tenebrosa]|uniref:Metalloendopeptidase n=1 Tax=Actinia tenebrosa TaxID=6105 RepID=A0A6P8HM97_ACTTE|nr:zinc metalloproteinase nas-13-like [Actinia tenebrosa]
MATQWILLLLLGCALATPFSRLTPEEEARRQKRQELLENPDTNLVDRILLVNEETDADSNLIDGDIAKNPKIRNEKRSSTHREVNYLWKSRIIPYVIDPSLSDAVSNITKAIANFHDKTCIKWVKRTNEPYYLLFKKLTGCWSFIGQAQDPRGYQEISIGNGCNFVGTIMHEMMHAVGVWHEQSRRDRGTKIEIMWEHIKDGVDSNFEAHGQETLNLQGTPYDPDSLMQYGNYAFSKDGKMTIRLLSNPEAVFGQREGFSNDDVIALNNLYSCSVTDGGWSLWTSYSPCDANCLKKRSRFCTNVNSAACNAAIPGGIEQQTKVCPNEECYAPVAGHWGKWSAWGACSATCDDGSHTRTRVCDDPAPKYGGAACAGSNSQTGVCKIKSCGGGPGDCEFDDDSQPLCDWQQDATDTQTKYPDWLRGSSTKSSNTGPVGDHTTGSGKFAFAEASGCLGNEGTTIRLQSVDFPATGGRCLTFWYYALGAKVGQLNAYVRDVGNGQMTKLHGISGNQGAEWKKFNVHFSHASTYKIVLEMVCGGDYRGDIAVDDIKFNDGPCA